MRTRYYSGAFVMLLLLGGSSACRQQVPEESSEQVIQVKTVIAEESGIIAPVRSSGKLASRTESKLSFKTGGIIQRIMVSEGQGVDKGQLLARLNLEEIQSQVKQADLVLAKAERDHERALNLYRDSVTTLEQLQNAGTALEVSKSNARIAAFNLSYSEIRAPSAGKILKRIAQENEIIAPGYPVFLFASTSGDWIVRSSVTDQDVIRIAMLDSAQVVFDAYPGEVFMGLVSEAGTASDPYTGTYELEIQLVRKPDRLVSGLIANILVYPALEERGIVLPLEALVEGAGLTAYVYIVEDGFPLLRKVRISRFVDKGMVVESGLLPGQEVVTQGARYLDAESKIKVNNAGSQDSH